jgi:membrane protease YdiL (CAAX protease family)
MSRYLALYAVALTVLVAGAAVPALAFFTPFGLGILFLGALTLWRLDGRLFADIGFPDAARWPWQLGAGVAAGLLLTALLTAALVLTGLATLGPGRAAGANLQPLILFAFVWPALIAASEEIVFRGCYYQVIYERFNLFAGAAVSAALWAAFHLPALASDGVPPLLMALGLLSFVAFGSGLSLAFVLAGASLWLPIGIHYGYNLGFSLIGALFTVEIADAPVLTGAAGWVPETGIVGVIGLALFAAVMAALLGRTILSG